MIQPNVFKRTIERFLMEKTVFQWRDQVWTSLPITLIGSSKFMFNELKKHGWALEAGSSQV